MAIPIIEHKTDCDQFVDRPGIGSPNDWFVTTTPSWFRAELDPPLTVVVNENECTINVYRGEEAEQQLIENTDLDMRLGCGRCQVISKGTFNYGDFEYVDW